MNAVDYVANSQVRFLITERDLFENKLMEEIRSDFHNYQYFDIGFGSLLKSMTQGINPSVLQSRAFCNEIKLELKLILSYLHMVREKNLIRDLKGSLFPMLFIGIAGNRTVIKQILLATHLSAKALPFITETYRSITEQKQNLDPELVATLYAHMLQDLKTGNQKRMRIERMEDKILRGKKRRQLKLFKLRRRNELRRKLSIPRLRKNPDDPYRELKVVSEPVMTHSEPFLRNLV